MSKINKKLGLIFFASLALVIASSANAVVNNNDLHVVDYAAPQSGSPSDAIDPESLSAGPTKNTADGVVDEGPTLIGEDRCFRKMRPDGTEKVVCRSGVIKKRKHDELSLSRDSDGEG